MENFIIIFVFVKAYFLILESLNRSSMLSLSSSIFLAWFVLNKRSKLDVQWSKPTKQLSFYASKCLSAYLGSKILLLILLGSIFFVTFSSLVLPLFNPIDSSDNLDRRVRPRMNNWLRLERNKRLNSMELEFILCRCRKLNILTIPPRHRNSWFDIEFRLNWARV